MLEYFPCPIRRSIFFTSGGVGSRVRSVQGVPRVAAAAQHDAGRVQAHLLLGGTLLAATLLGARLGRGKRTGRMESLMLRRCCEDWKRPFC